jgi:hypothetical protein
MKPDWAALSTQPLLITPAHHSAGFVPLQDFPGRLNFGRLEKLVLKVQPLYSVAYGHFAC